MSNLDISTLAALPLELRLKKLERIKRDAVNQTESEYTQARIGILKELEAKAIRNNPIDTQNIQPFASSCTELIASRTLSCNRHDKPLIQLRLHHRT